MKKLSVLVLLVFSLLFASSAEAKVLPQSKKATGTITPTGTGVNVAVKLRADRKAVIVYFSNLQNAKAVSYSLTYSTNSQEEGAVGSLNLGKAVVASQELLFGTCSKGVCTYHVGVKNVKLEVSYTTKAGKKYIKRFKIKV